MTAAQPPTWQLSRGAATRHRRCSSPLRAGEASVPAELLPHAPAPRLGQELVCPARFYLQPTGCRSSARTGWRGGSPQAHSGALPAPQCPQLQAHIFPQDRASAPLAPESNSPSLLLRLTLQPWDASPCFPLHRAPSAGSKSQLDLQRPASSPPASEGYKQSQIWPQI